tara:strand:+ start:180 stop:542 length:363 start_codon:yes stop_codon:yes gene_type:complete
MTLSLTDLVVIIHALFIIFVLFGGLIVLKWRQVMWIHIPCALWGAAIEFFGWVCPLTHLEIYLREIGNANSYDDSFIQHYLLPVIYPSGLTPTIQWLLGIIVILTNLIIYSFVWHQKHKR